MGFSCSSTLSSTNPPPSPFPLELRDDTVNSTVAETLSAAEATPLIQLPIPKTENFGIPQPLERLQGSPIPPFLSKTFDLVDDPSLDPIITWASTGESFVVREPMEFARLVLPRNFKHSNFSSFVRQLNTYGFRKVDADKWEFANGCFVRGKKHLLKNIQRRRSTTQSHPQPSSCGGGSDESVKSRAIVEKMKEEKCVLMQEVEELQKENRGTANRVEVVKRRLQASEERHKEMISLIAKIFQDPVFVERLYQMKAHCELGLPRTRRKLVKQELQEGGGSGSCGGSMEEQIVNLGPKLSNPVSSDIPKYEPSSPEYLLLDMVRNSSTDMDLPLEELAAVQELTNVREQVGAEALISEPGEPLLKENGILSPELGVASPDCFMTFPEDSAVEKVFLECPSPGAENLVKQEEMLSMGFDANVFIPIPASDTELWGNGSNYDFPDIGLPGSDGFSDIWGLGSLPAAGCPGVEK